MLNVMVPKQALKPVAANQLQHSRPLCMSLKLNAYVSDINLFYFHINFNCCQYKLIKIMDTGALGTAGAIAQLLVVLVPKEGNKFYLILNIF
jgi:hypothetical protein